MLNQIKTLLNIEVKLEDMKLENGTIVSAESFEEGKEIFIVTDDEKVAMPVGEYILEDSRLLVVTEELKKLYNSTKKKEEMSSVRKPIKHNPEAKQKKQVEFAKGQFNTTLDRVLNKLNK